MAPVLSKSLPVVITATSLSILGLAYVIRTQWKRTYLWFPQLFPCRSAPKLTKTPHYVPFGDVSGQNRGQQAMKNLIYLKDDYFYARDDTRKNPDILAHLQQENAYTAHATSHLGSCVSKVYDELLSHIQETDTEVPYPYDAYQYYTKTEKGQSYAIYARTPLNSTVEEIILDVNQVAVGTTHCEIGTVQPSPGHDIIAYSVDTQGYETYRIVFKALRTGEMLTDVIEGTSGRIVWGKDARTVYYSTMDEAHRTNKIWKHVMGSPSSQDVCIYEEDNEVFSAYFSKTRSGRFLIVGSHSSETSEAAVLDLDMEDETEISLKIVRKREFGVQYEVDHHGDFLYLVTNRDGATNFKLSKIAIGALEGEEDWKDVIPYDAKKKVDGIDCFKNHMVISGRENGLTQLWIMDLRTENGEIHRMQMDEPLYTVYTSINKNFDTDKVRITFSSLTTPRTTYNYNMDTKKMIFLKEKPCPNYDRSLYTTERLHATSEDGTKIPMSMIYRTDKRQPNTPGPVHLYGYGSYEISIDPSFSSTILPLLDHGVTYVIAHIRGGGEMGRTWYEDTKYLNKRRTFEDFVACAQHLINTKYTTPELMTCEGRSAGGLLIGAVINMRPDLFKAAVAGVPFVDVMNTMCDSTIPLTTGEWEEWGNPNEEKFFHYMLSYSPYENIKAQDYPNMLVTSGLYDPRVAYWEPTKWVAKLRDMKTNDSKILLKMDLSSGHFSASDRYHYLREKAFDTAYILDQLGLVTMDESLADPHGST